ncbi:MAG: class I SAM-dependent methyltransferase [Deltaproteobacteria bacterium]|nr:class I SAM-dependent methyltransferase [Deltaproteobacteria bacterium]
MLIVKVSEEKIQQRYYANTASQYDKMHVGADDQHLMSLSYISAFLPQLGARTMLDLGCGTCRALAYLADRHPDVALYGIEPVSQMLRVAVEKGIARTCLVNGSGSDLPFKDGSFDVVVECGVLHHVRRPARVVDEMMRVARKAVFLSDSNIFGQGRLGVRLLKLALYRLGFWKFVKLIQTRGKGYTISEGDGLAYSYSVYFQYERLRDWAERMIAIPVRESGHVSISWSPVCTADVVLLCGMR